MASVDPADGPAAAEKSVRQHIDRIVDTLEEENATVDPATLRAVVEADFHRYEATAKFLDFVPVFVERDVRAQLRHVSLG